MVERAPAAVESLKRNIATLGAAGAEVVALDAMQFLARPVEPFDIVFLDPPFASAAIERCAHLLHQRGWVKPGGLVYVEAPRTLKPLPLPAAWGLMKSKTAGQVGYHLLRVPPYLS